MNDTLAPLFEPWTIGSLTIKNRIVMTSMGGTDLFGWMEKNHFDRAGAEFLLEVAKHDAGLVLPGCQPVYNPMFGQWLHKNKKMYRDLAAWMPVFHATGAKLFVQLTAGFGRSFTISPLMEALYTNPVLRAAAKPVMDLERICAAPSPSPNRWSDKVPSREITKPEIDQIIESFAESSRLLKEAGVDGVEVHAVHEGYLLDQFALKYVNKRTDEYGGSLENRYRFAAKIVRAIKRACGDDFPVSIRYSVESKTKGLRQGALPGEQFVEAGRDMAESIEAARYLADAGCDMFNCDNGTYDAWYWAHPPIYMPKNCNLGDVAELRRHIDVPVVCAGRMEPADAAAAIAEKRIDAAGFARPFLADPAWVSKLKAGREADIRPCILCHNGCFNMCHYKGVANDQDLMDSLHLARCAVNAETMQTSRHYVKPTSSPKTIHIVGGGIGGMECARVLALRGHHPVIHERGERLGGVFVAAAQAGYKDKMRDLLAWYERQMVQLNVDVRLSDEVRDITELDGPVVVATGSTPRTLPIPGIELAHEACDYLENPPAAQRVVVVGGGLTGCEVAYDAALEGRDVEIVEMADDLVAQKGVCLANSSYLREWFAWKQVPVHLETTLAGIARAEDAGLRVSCRHADGTTFVIEADAVVTATGYTPAPLARSGRGVRLVGDCNGVGNLRSVIWRAYDVAMKL